MVPRVLLVVTLAATTLRSAVGVPITALGGAGSGKGHQNSLLHPHSRTSQHHHRGREYGATHGSQSGSTPRVTGRVSVTAFGRSSHMGTGGRGAPTILDSPDWAYTATRRQPRTGLTVGVDGADPDIFDVRTFGAVGDSIADDTHAFEAALTAGASGGVLYTPPGTYRISSVLAVPSALSVQGSGWDSILLWTEDADLLVWATPAQWISVVDIAITSVGKPKSANSTALRFGVGPGTGAQRVVIDRVLVFGDGGAPIPNTTLTGVPGGSAIDLGPVSDTSTVRDTVLWFFGIGTGIKIGRGSEVRIEGGRVIGANKHGATTVDDAISGPIGIHVTGNNGGVHVDGTDVIGLGIGLLLDTSNGQGSNREIFVTHATFDSDGVGLLVRDASYVSIAGCWAASSDFAQIWLAPTAFGAILSVAGGTIFNGGAYYSLPDPSSPCPLSTGCNGLLVEAGSFMLTGVAVRNNHGAGVAVRQSSKEVYVSHFAITGCQLKHNGAAFVIDGAAFAITGNVLYGNYNDSHVAAVKGVDEPAPVVANNVGLTVT
eukprot:m.147450 g.147450  ORF g.147450 m.147450 type:complete len:544 (+) comp23148_c1_seq1:21-1652(+)